VTEYAVAIMPSRNLRETLKFYERLGFEMRGAPPRRTPTRAGISSAWARPRLALGGHDLKELDAAAHVLQRDRADRAEVD
jgi:hypothetical protein